MEDHIKFRSIRPKIYVETDLSVEEIHQRVKNYLSKADCRCKGQITKGYASLFPPEGEQHFWSPQLTITMQTEGQITKIHGLYGPRPSVWTMFVFFYAAIAFALLIVSMIGLSYWSLNKPATILWLVPVLVLIFLSLYLVAYFGQKLGHKQMTNLHRALEQCIGEKIDPT
jgi:uncharacterized membrane protein